MIWAWFSWICSRIKMAAVRQPPYASIPKQLKEIEDIPMSRNHIRRIRKCPGAVLKLGDQGQTSPLKYVFGPLYRTETSSASGKEDAWRRVLQEEGENQNEIIGKYTCAMRKIENKARAAYGEGALNDITESEFRWMMIKDGCFFLHLALCILGNSEQSGYLEDHLISEEKQSKKNKKTQKTLQERIKSMFLVGNQIPLVVLNELMKQNFFQKVINSREWRRPSDILSKQILHDLLVIPAKEFSLVIPAKESSNPTETYFLWKNPARKTYLLWKKLARKIYLPDQEQPSDLLHGLQLLLLGRGSRTDSTENERQDALKDEDLEAGIEIKSSPKAEDRENKNDGRKELGASDLQNKCICTKDNENKDDDRKKLCASELRKKGILIWKSKTAGSRGIRFRNWIIFASLTLPTLKVNHDTNVLFTNLKYYEIAHQQNEVRSYLRFLSELISTYEDVNLLASKGIIGASTSEEKEWFLTMLKTLADKETTHHHHRSVLGRVKDYSIFPWERFKYVAIIVFFLTIAQTVFSVLSYLLGLRQLHQSPRG